MPANRNALIRYKTIDNCLRNPYRQWTLDDLTDACSDALHEYEGIDKGISRRTIQMDIQLMRSEKLGYNAPIVVYENKYYKYDDPQYSITNTPLSDNDLHILFETVEVLKQFKGFTHFDEMTDIVSRLEDHVSSVRHHTQPVIDFEKNEYLTGIQYLNPLYQAITRQQTLVIQYRSFQSRSEKNITLFPYLLKEYRNRWFIFGIGTEKEKIYNLALDRIKGIENSDIPFQKNHLFNPSTYFDDIVGVTKLPGSKPKFIRFHVTNEHASYILTKPIHRSQQLIEKCQDGSMIFGINVIVNKELYREILGYGGGIKILSPFGIVQQMKKFISEMNNRYR